MGGYREISEEFPGNSFPENHRVVRKLKVVCTVKREIEIFTIGLQENYPMHTTMVHPPIEYLKICNFPQIPSSPKTFICILTSKLSLLDLQL